MLDPKVLAEYDSTLSKLDEKAAQERVELFQKFMQLYEHNPDFVDEILSLEGPMQLTSRTAAQYIQGVVTADEIYLVSNLPTGQSQRFVAKNGTWAMGRDPRQSDLVIPDKRLSRCHAAIQYGKDGFLISDLESTNGTYVNGELVRRVYTLKDGDRVRLGRVTFHFYACYQQPLQPQKLDTSPVSKDDVLSPSLAVMQPVSK
ncbi:MAG: FHA domain-containing protein [Cyanobacteria bacterium P01_D01_bin.44]